MFWLLKNSKHMNEAGTEPSAGAGAASVDEALPGEDGAASDDEPVEAKLPAEGEPADGGQPAEGEDEPVVMLGDAELAPPQAAPAWVGDLRRKFREQSRELAKYRAGQPVAAPDALPPPPGRKPSMADPDIDFDADKFTAALDTWHEASRKRADAERKASDHQAQEQRAWHQQVEAYNAAGKKLGFTDFDDCEAAATSELSETQQAIIVRGAESAEKAALIMYALGRNATLLRDMAKIADPVQFAFSIATLQGKLTVTKRKPTTKPESTIPASGASASAALAGQDKRTEALREEAIRTGDMTKLLAHRRAMAQRKAA